MNGARPLTLKVISSVKYFSLHYINMNVTLCLATVTSAVWLVYNISSSIFAGAAAGPDDGQSSIKFHKTNLALSALFICYEDKDKD